MLFVGRGDGVQVFTWSILTVKNLQMSFQVTLFFILRWFFHADLQQTVTDTERKYMCVTKNTVTLKNAL